MHHCLRWGKLADCVRIFSDGCLFGTIPGLPVLKGYRGQGIGRELMRRAAERSPTSPIKSFTASGNSPSHLALKSGAGLA